MGLVERVEFDDGTHQWELTDAAQHRLDDLTPERRRASATLAYLDHWCSSCRQQRLTHLVDGSYLCVECQQFASKRAASAAHRQARGGTGSRRLRPEPLSGHGGAGLQPAGFGFGRDDPDVKLLQLPSAQ